MHAPLSSVPSSPAFFILSAHTAKRSIISAKALASFIPEIAGLSGVYNLTGNHHPALTETEKIIGEMLGKKIKTLPRILLKLISLAGDIIPVLPLNSYRLKKLTSTLTFSDEKARKLTGWNPDDLNLLKELS